MISDNMFGAANHRVGGLAEEAPHVPTMPCLLTALHVYVVVGVCCCRERMDMEEEEENNSKRVRT